MNRTAIVFGARTALGMRLVDHLATSGIDVSAARLWDEKPARPDVAQDVVASLSDDSLVDALIGKNWVFVATLPGLDLGPSSFLGPAVLALRNLVTAAREAGIDRIILTLPASIAWSPGQVVDHDHRYVFGSAADPWADTFYTLAQEAGYATAEGVDIVTIASALVVGPGVAPLRVVLNADARDIDVVHIDEAARMHVEAGRVAPWGATYLLGGHTLRRQQLPEWIPAPRRHRLIARGGDDPRRHLVDPGMKIDPRRAVEELGFRPSSGF